MFCSYVTGNYRDTHNPQHFCVEPFLVLSDHFVSCIMTRGTIRPRVSAKTFMIYGGGGVN